MSFYAKSLIVSVLTTKVFHSKLRRRDVKEIKIVTDLVPSHIIIRKSEFTVNDLDTASKVKNVKAYKEYRVAEKK